MQVLVNARNIFAAFLVLVIVLLFGIQKIVIILIIITSMASIELACDTNLISMLCYATPGTKCHHSPFTVFGQETQSSLWIDFAFSAEKKKRAKDYNSQSLRTKEVHVR